MRNKETILIYLPESSCFLFCISPSYFSVTNFFRKMFWALSFLDKSIPSNKVGTEQVNTYKHTESHLPYQVIAHPTKLMITYALDSLVFLYPLQPFSKTATEYVQTRLSKKQVLPDLFQVSPFPQMRSLSSHKTSFALE